MEKFDQIWRWDYQGFPGRIVDRKGERCRIVLHAPAMNSILVEFEDGYRVNTSKWAVRPRRQGEQEQLSFFGGSDNE